MLHSFNVVSHSKALEAKRVDSWLQKSSKEREVMPGSSMKKKVMEVLRYISDEMNQGSRTGASNASEEKVRFAEDRNGEQSEALRGIGACFDS